MIVFKDHNENELLILPAGKNHRLLTAQGVNVQGKDLSNVDLSGWDISGADFRGAILTGADFECADLSGVDFRGAELDTTTREGTPIPIIKSIDAQILAAIEGAGNHLYMLAWHAIHYKGTCGTTHCRAGWAIHLAGAAGYALEKEIGPCAAGALIYALSRPDMPVPDFYASGNATLVDIRRCAALQLEAEVKGAVDIGLGATVASAEYYRPDEHKPCPDCGKEYSVLVGQEIEGYVHVCENSECPNFLKEHEDAEGEGTA